MPAVSKKQQRFFGIVRAIQKGEMSPTTPETAKAAADMKKSDVKDFASTKHKKLPEKVVAKNEEIEIIEGSSIRQGQTSKKKVSYRGATSDVKRDKDGNIPASHYKKEKPNIVSIKKKDTRTDDQKKKHSDSVRKYDNYKKLQAKIFAKDDARKKANQEYDAKKKMNEEKENGRCKAGQYYCYTDKVCKPIPSGFMVDPAGMLRKENGATVDEGWSDKYKKSINCDNPKGFSQRAHCQGKKKKTFKEFLENI